ncbi:MAG: hypothetical protein MR419_01015 [Clostridiales bacterium]|nr:hypothetical protein [Clostridiales bacterium]MDY4173599.1 hypothetical protein [Evtepia sp.]
MKNKAAKALLRENNDREKALSPAGQKEMTDVVVYLRGQDLSLLQQEEVRRDLIAMALAGEARGETVAQVVGEDYRFFCDEIVDALPRRSPASRVLAAVDDVLPALSILLGIWVVKKVVEAGLNGESLWRLTLTLGEAASIGIMLAAAVGMVAYTCQTALERPDPAASRGKKCLLAWIFWVVLLAAVLLPSLLLTSPLCGIQLPVAVVIALAPLAVSGLLSQRQDL